MVDEPTRINFMPLSTVVSFDGFDFNTGNIEDQEKTILQPQIDYLGFTDCQWAQGDIDNFGPHTRVCICYNKAGTKIYLVYNYG